MMSNRDLLAIIAAIVVQGYYLGSDPPLNSVQMAVKDAAQILDAVDHYLANMYITQQ